MHSFEAGNSANEMEWVPEAGPPPPAPPWTRVNREPRRSGDPRPHTGLPGTHVDEGGVDVVCVLLAPLHGEDHAVEVICGAGRSVT